MHRYLEKNTGSIPLSKHQMELVRKAQRLYNEANLAVDAVEKELGITPARAALLINHNTHAVSFDALYEEEQNCPIAESVEHSVLKKIQIELLEEQFRKLSAKEQYILGSCYGVFGFEQKSVDDLSFEEMLTPDGVYKAKEAALERLRKLCRDSAIPIWRRVSRSLRQVAQSNAVSEICTTALFDSDFSLGHDWVTTAARQNNKKIHARFSSQHKLQEK